MFDDVIQYISNPIIIMQFLGDAPSRSQSVELAPPLKLKSHALYTLSFWIKIV